MAKISIIKELCKACGKCVDICPEELFIQKKPGAVPRLLRQKDCIGCGHCAAICPYGAIDHPDFLVKISA